MDSVIAYARLAIPQDRSARFGLMCLVFVITGMPIAVHSAETIDEIELKRHRTGVFVGTDVVSGHLGFRSDTVISEIQLTAMPAVYFGMDLWPEEHIGVYMEGYLGTGATIQGVLEAEVPINTMEYHLGGRYRWYLGPNATAIALGLGLSVHGFHQWVQDQRPSVLLDRTILGPRMTPFVTIPVVGGDLGYVQGGG